MPIRKRITDIFTNPFLRNISKMMSGTGFAHIIAILVYPVLTRIYTPEDIGIFAAYIAVFMLLSPVASLRYEYATLLPSNPAAARNITVLALLFASVFSALFMFFLFISGDAIAALTGLDAAGNLLYLMPFSVFAYSVFMILTFHLNRSKEYGTIAGGKITASSTIALGQVSLSQVPALLNHAGLILGKAAGDTAGLIFLIWKTNKIGQALRAGVTPKRLRAMALRYKNFPLYNAPHALTTSTSNNFPVLLFNVSFSEAIAGFYAMAVKICYSPVQVISQAVYQVFGQRIAEKHHKREALTPFFFRNMGMLAAAGLLPFGFLFLFGPAFFTWLLGEGWEQTGIYVQILTPFIYLTFISSPFNFIALLADKQRAAFLIDICYLVVRVMALLTGVWFNSVITALYLYSATGILFNSILLVWFYRLTLKLEQR